MIDVAKFAASGEELIVMLGPKQQKALARLVRQGVTVPDFSGDTDTEDEGLALAELVEMAHGVAMVFPRPTKREP